MGASIEQLEASRDEALENLKAASALVAQLQDRLHAAYRERDHLRSIRQAFLIIADDLRVQTQTHKDSPQDVAFAMTQAVEDQDLGYENEVSEALEFVLLGQYLKAAEGIEDLCEALATEAEEVTA